VIDSLARDLDRAHVEQAAQFAAEQLASRGVARVRLTPGDFTEYQLMVAAPGLEWAAGSARPHRAYLVSLCDPFGASYPWSAGEVNPRYAVEKWTQRDAPEGTRRCTGQVVALFLNALSVRIEALAEEES